MKMIETAAECLTAYAGSGYHMLLFAAALAYILFQREEKTHRRLFVGSVCLFTVIYFCPLTAGIITKCIGAIVYWRMLWILPLPVVISYAAVRVCRKPDAGWKRAGLILLFAGMICLTGKNVYLQDSPYEKAVNMQKVPSTPAAICRIIRENLEEGETAKLAAPEDVVGYVRQYDAGIQLTYGRRGKARRTQKGIRRRIAKQLNSEEINYKKLTKRLRKSKTNFIVLGPAEGTEEEMSQYGFEVIGTAGAYVIYKDMQ